MADAQTATELNRLYWDTDVSVSEIADRVDISRRALYDAIEPRPAGDPCPECGAPLGFRNRTALQNREAECPECGFETVLEEDRPEGQGPAAADTTVYSTPRRLPDPVGGAALGSAFLVGLGVGALATYLVQR